MAYFRKSLISTYSGSNLKNHATWKRYAFDNTGMQVHLKIQHLTLVTTFWQYLQAVFNTQCMNKLAFMSVNQYHLYDLNEQLDFI